jgi:cytochrome P450
MRRIVQQAFTPKRLESLRGAVTGLAGQLLDAATTDDSGFDLHDDFAFPLPVTIIAGMLGVPTADLDRFKHWSDVQVAAMGSEDPARYVDEQTAFMAYMTSHFAGRRDDTSAGRSVPDDLLTLIARARDPDGELLTEADALSVLTQLLVGGNETTTSLITNAVWRLLADRSLWEALVADPSLAEAAIEESLRLDPPVLGLYRNTTRDVTLHGTTIPEGSKVYINYAAANRDPTVFPDPDRFDLQRERKRHMSFGLGTHFCLGAPMARMEAEIALVTLVTRLPGLTLEGPGERIAPFFLWGRRKLPVRANPRNIRND